GSPAGGTTRPMQSPVTTRGRIDDRLTDRPGRPGRDRIAPSMTGALPRWESVLAVVAHPDDESFGLGALLDGFVQAGARVSVLCLTQGEATTLGAPGPDLRHLRAMELQSASGRLGVASA